MCVCVCEVGVCVCVTCVGCVCVASAHVRLRARAHMVGLDETTKEIKHLEAISTFSPVSSRSSDGMKMRTYERERARACVRNKLEFN